MEVGHSPLINSKWKYLKKKLSILGNFFEKVLDDFCDEYFLILRKEDCKLFNETDKIFDTFRYQYVKFESVYGGKPRENKKDNARKDQSSQAIECFVFDMIKN